jgi:hypothetical protein
LDAIKIAFYETQVFLSPISTRVKTVTISTFSLQYGSPRGQQTKAPVNSLVTIVEKALASPTWREKLLP